MTRLRGPSAGSDTLHALGRLFARLDARGIVYCQWKSNEHLRAALMGRTDLDLLVDRRAALPLAGILGACGFKRFQAPSWRAYPAVEDYLGLDAPTGALVHLHVHFALTLGERALKGYRLPWEDALLAARRRDERGEVYVADPRHELLLLLVRAALKLRTRDRLRALLGRPGIPAGTLRELRWLEERVGRDALAEVARPLVGERATELLLGMLGGQPSVHRLLALRRSVVPRLDEYRTYGALEARYRRWGRELHGVAARGANRWLRAGWPTRRIRPQGGLVIALVGPDGAGKSTLTRAITHWLLWKVDAVQLYLGTGGGLALRTRRALVRMRESLAPPGSRDGAARGARSGEAKDAPRYARSSWPWPRRVWRLWLALSRARAARVRLWQLRRLVSRGMIVVCDRFPQQQFTRLNDGPLLTDWEAHEIPLLRAAARRERATFAAFAACAPDLVIKLHVEPEVARRRRPEMTHAHLRAKADAIAAMQYPASTRVVDVDASRPLEQVLLDVKRAVWASL